MAFQRGRRIAAVFSLVLAACGPVDLERHEQEPEGAFESSEQGLVTCTERKDTGYSSGNPYPITVVNCDGKPCETKTANAYSVMQAAAAKVGVKIWVVSGFRTMSEQKYLYSCFVNCSCNNCNLAARPGYSNHQSGRALDLNTSSSGVYAWLTANAAYYGFKRTVSQEIWHWELLSPGPGGGPCGQTENGCTTGEAEGCAKFGCGCADHACSGGACPGTGCGKQHTKDCGAFGCNCADGKCGGGYCPGSGCTAREKADCTTKGCGCVDHVCSGGSCEGTGCTARQDLDCSKADAGCAKGVCVRARLPDAGVKADGGIKTDGGVIFDPVDLPDAGDDDTGDGFDPSVTPNTFIGFDAGAYADPVVGVTCSSVPGGALALGVLAAASLRRRRRS